MKLKTLGIIGFGSITTELLGVLNRTLPSPLEQITLLVRPGRAEHACKQLSQYQGNISTQISATDDARSFTNTQFDLVVEAAGHGAVSEYVVALLENGVDTVIASTGALSDSALHATLKKAAISGDSQLILPSGAVGGLDILAGLRNATIKSVAYTSRKPPSAWKGTDAQSLIDLDTLTDEHTFYRGTAREAAAKFPKNANVAASIALAGAGFDKTNVCLVADPKITENIHTFDVQSDAANVHVAISGKPSALNPKTSLPTVYSLVREIMRRVQSIVS